MNDGAKTVTARIEYICCNKCKKPLTENDHVLQIRGGGIRIDMVGLNHTAEFAASEGIEYRHFDDCEPVKKTDQFRATKMYTIAGEHLNSIFGIITLIEKNSQQNAYEFKRMFGRTEFADQLRRLIPEGWQAHFNVSD